MKKLHLVTMFVLLLVATPTISTFARSNDPVKERVANMTDAEKKARAEAIKERVYEIKAMDRSKLTKAERKALRSELKDMKKEARAIQGIYLSVGAVIIIILLLILII